MIYRISPDYRPLAVNAGFAGMMAGIELTLMRYRKWD